MSKKVKKQVGFDEEKIDISYHHLPKEAPRELSFFEILKESGGEVYDDDDIYYEFEDDPEETPPESASPDRSTRPQTQIQDDNAET